MRVLGLMSGTSADGVDAVLVRFSGPCAAPRWQILASASRPYPAALQQRLIEAGQGAALDTAALLALAEAVTEQQALAAQACDPDQQAQLVGCHGQTVWHRPPQHQQRGASLQLLQAPLLATLLGQPVVFDFRAADLALGGQGAPLVPPADLALLGRTDGWRGVLNLGGIANITLIPPRAGPEQDACLRGWDCGPANSLIDLAVQRFSGGSLKHDLGGAWAGRGTADESLIHAWLQEPYPQQRPPKSTGRELYGRSDLQRRLAQMGDRDPADVLATLTGFAAACVAQDLQPRPLELLVAGGGARNQTLMAELRRRCRGTIVRPLADLGIADQQREALAFALLAWWHWRHHPGNAISVTGAAASAVLGLRADPAGRVIGVGAGAGGGAPPATAGADPAAAVPGQP
ncbi:MAG: anhydro-N-acetylmuramic acid kinase [Synechococcaceae bacterium WB9_2_112]|nr:anhydro-N-acetylmuramic acid kinase [Synechococcaceae bacterium WB9_2_112]